MVNKNICFSNRIEKSYARALYKSIILFIFVVAHQYDVFATQRVYQFGVDQQVSFFSKAYDAQYQSALHIGTKRSTGSYTFRLHRGFRFNQYAYMWELESYPVFTNSMYAYVAYAYSNSDIFPSHRVGLELFSALPGQLEGSVGIRYIDVDSGSQTLMLTTSLSHYISAFIITVRPFFIFSDSGTGQTWLGSLRWSLNDSGNYLLIRGAVGSSSDEIIFQVAQEQVKDLLLLKSSQIGTEGRYYITKSISGLAAMTLYRQELAFDPGNFVSNWTVRAALNFHW